jgi:hypothetical protein
MVSLTFRKVASGTCFIRTGIVPEKADSSQRIKANDHERLLVAPVFGVV